MTFAGVDYWAVVIAAIVGYAAGALWYWGWSKPWMEAQGFTPEAMKASQSPVPYLLAFAANLLMAWMLAGVIGHLGIGEVTLRNGVISAAAVWLGFVATTQTVNYLFGKRPLKLLLIDGGHWLIVLLLQGAVIGFMGVS
ncbi:MAG TPA: DUF1761 domain-containing protein [Xanthobacteraceae bacterium]|nr:DUF1761 domain-containing protein [Xanthobacteraceae bacterium]